MAQAELCPVFGVLGACQRIIDAAAQERRGIRGVVVVRSADRGV